MPERTKNQVAAEAWGSLLRAHARLVPAMDADLKRAAGLQLAWYDILLELYYADGQALTMTDLAERVVLSRTRVSRVVDEMVQSGLVERVQHPDDKRSALASLTEQGRRRFRAAAPTYLASIDRYVADPLSKAELETLRALLTRLTEAPTSRSIPR